MYDTYVKEKNKLRSRSSAELRKKHKTFGPLGKMMVREILRDRGETIRGETIKKKRVVRRQQSYNPWGMFGRF